MNYEKRIYLTGILIMLPVIAMILAVLLPAPAAAETEAAASVQETEEAAEGVLETDFAGIPQKEEVKQRTQRVRSVKSALKEENEPETEKEAEEAEGRGTAVRTGGDHSISGVSGDDREDAASDTAGDGNIVGSTEQASGDNSGDDEQTGSSESTEGDGRKTECIYYTVSGIELSRDLQRYLYDRLSEFGCEWFFRYALCQIFQESQFNAAAENPNGLDKGLCQFRITYFPYVAQEAGLVEYDVFNPIDSLYVYAYMMCKYLNETGGDVAMSLSLYHSGYGGPYSAQYVSDVTRWFETIKEAESE